MFEKKPKAKDYGFEPYKWLFMEYHAMLVRVHNHVQQAKIEMWLSLEEIFDAIQKELKVKGLALIENPETVGKKTSQYID